MFVLFTGPMARMGEETKCKHLLYWSGECGIELFNSWDLGTEEQKKLENYWENFESYVKPHSRVDHSLEAALPSSRYVL